MQPPINVNNNTEAIQSMNTNNNNRLSITDLNEMVIDPEKYDAMRLKPYFRRIPREGLGIYFI